MSDFNQLLGQSLAKPEQSIRQHTDGLLKQAELLNNLGFISSSELYHDLLTACEFHDYGKANSEFQKRIKTHKRFDPSKEVPHNVLSLYYVNENDCQDYLLVCFAVLYHHYHSKSPMEILEDDKELIRKSLLEFEDESIVKKRLVRIKRLKAKFNNLFQKDMEEKTAAILLKGFLHKCDYSASAGIPCEIPNNFLSAIMTDWSQSYPLRDLQEFCLANRDRDIIATAPTGMGKTEAGLLWCGDNKCFFVLPLKTAINAMYERLKKLVGGDNYKDCVGLLHSDTKMIYALGSNREENPDTIDTDLDYLNRTKQLSMPITVCTPDQIFDFVLKYAGYEYKLATTSYAKFIIDEIQAYDPKLLAAIMYAIKLVKLMGGKIAILTATLPPFVHRELKKILGENCPDMDFSGDGITRHNIRVYDKTMSAEDVISVIDCVKSDKVKKFLVVCNSIDTANMIFEQLTKYYSSADVEVNLLHARFTKHDRGKKENAILNVSENPAPEIWVSTSVVEASLDIDFDVLFTELSEIFSLFQRMGRVNRQGKKPFDKTNCYIYTELQGNAKKYNMYDKSLHDLSKQAVMSVSEGVLDEQAKHDLIEQYMSCEKVETTQFFKDYQSVFKEYETLKDYINARPKQGLRDIFSYDVIPLPIYEKKQAEIEQAMEILSGKYPPEEKLRAQNVINQLTVSVRQHRVNKNIDRERSDYKLGILVLQNCAYSFEKGLTFLKTENSQNSSSQFM